MSDQEKMPENNSKLSEQLIQLNKNLEEMNNKKENNFYNKSIKCIKQVGIWFASGMVFTLGILGAVKILKPEISVSCKIEE